jgi:hypothetical protein
VAQHGLRLRRAARAPPAPSPSAAAARAFAAETSTSRCHRRRLRRFARQPRLEPRCLEARGRRGVARGGPPATGSVCVCVCVGVTAP